MTARLNLVGVRKQIIPTQKLFSTKSAPKMIFLFLGTLHGKILIFSMFKNH